MDWRACIRSFDHHPCAVCLASTPIREVEQRLQLELDDEDVDTATGILIAKSGKLPAIGDRVEFAGAVAEVLEVVHDHATKIRFTILNRDEALGGLVADQSLPPDSP